MIHGKGLLVELISVVCGLWLETVEPKTGLTLKLLNPEAVNPECLTFQRQNGWCIFFLPTPLKFQVFLHSAKRNTTVVFSEAQ